MTKAKLTPMMRQYLSVKEKYPDKILFFRMGDFYEMFGEDAREAAPILGIALTSRSGDKGNAIPLCGIPHHAVDKYLPRLIEAGKKVVICEQVEDPKEAKGIVKRDVVEIITPGTSIGESTLIPSQPSYLMAVSAGKNKMGLARLELSTGDFTVIENEPRFILDQLEMSPPKELLIPAEERENLFPKSFFQNGLGEKLTSLENIYFDYRLGKERLLRFFSVSTLDGFGLGGMNPGIAAAGAIFKYLEDNKQSRLDHITKIRVGRIDSRMILDAASVRNLELFYNQAVGGEKHSLFWAVNRTGSAAGARRLRKSLAAPYLEKDKIDYRQEAVAELFENQPLSENLLARTRELPDLERLCGRLGMGKANPRTLLSIAEAIRTAQQIQTELSRARTKMLSDIFNNLPDLSATEKRIARAIRDDAPLAANSGSIIKKSYSSDLDGLNNSIKEAREYISGLAKVERERTGIPSLKVGFNKVFGYYIEITRTHADKVPGDYIRKQTLVNAERYITDEMKQKEGLILEAEEKINRLEEKLFYEVAESIAAELPRLLSLADLLAEVDVVNGFAVLARQENYICPEIVEKLEIEIEEGRHPVICQIMGKGQFVANDTILNDNDTTLVILTGPNMSGKSTWLRQTGLIVIMAQVGSFVPAKKARIGLVDRVFTRVGANDNLTRGQSTFLVEMVETANILHNMSPRSLLLLDEIGRGTSTFDGLSMAWAVAETIYNHDGGTPRALFATHYHEMTGLAAIYPRIKNFQVTVKKWGQEIIFLHQVKPGGCDDSYGIEVARLAGVPKGTIKRAREILRLLDSGKFAKSELAKGVHARLNQPTLFETAAETKPSLIEDEIKELDINGLTPMQALEILARMKKELDND